MSLPPEKEKDGFRGAVKSDGENKAWHREEFFPVFPGKGIHWQTRHWKAEKILFGPVLQKRDFPPRVPLGSNRSAAMSATSGPKSRKTGGGPIREKGESMGLL